MREDSRSTEGLIVFLILGSNEPKHSIRGRRHGRKLDHDSKLFVMHHITGKGKETERTWKKGPQVDTSCQHQLVGYLRLRQGTFDKVDTAVEK